MQWMIDLSTRAKLLLSFGAMIICLGIVMVTAYRGIATIEASQRTLFDKDFSIVTESLTLRAEQNRSRTIILEMILTDDPAVRQALEQDLRQRVNAIDERLQGLTDIVRGDAMLAAQLAKLERARSAYREELERELVLIAQGDVTAAKQLSEGPLQQQFETIRALALELSEVAREHAQRAVEEAAAGARATLHLFVGLGVLALLLGLTLAMSLSGSIAKPLTEVAALAERIAAGELDIAVPASVRADEVGMLLQAFVRMITALQGMAAMAGRIAAGDPSVTVAPRSKEDALGTAFATMVENLRRLTSELGEGISVLATSANEISASTVQFAATASQTAAAVGETTTTVEELRQTAELSSQKARTVSEAAQKVAQVAQGGRLAIEETIEGMSRIREQMAAIADSMLRLSELNQSVGQIVSTVEDLAAQSNLLAVNASIEAAKAGESGKGFAVVAQEIRSLAEQSKQATAQVRTIINDIQKATGAAVLVTEQGSKAVEAGVVQSSRAGQSIQSLAAGMSESAQAAAQISVSSQQQLVGVDQVATAMEGIRQASMQNAESARQLEEAAHELKRLGERLTQMVAHYRMQEAPAGLR